MLNTLEKINSKEKFLETKFKEYPFKLKKEFDINSSSYQILIKIFQKAKEKNYQKNLKKNQMKI